MAVHRSLPLGHEHAHPSAFRPSVRRCRRCGIAIGYRDRCDFCLDRPSDHVDAPGEYVGRHHSEWITTVQALMADEDYDGAEFLLWRLVEASESESMHEGNPPLEQHFRQLRWIALKRGDSALARQLTQRYEECKAAAARLT